jgi:uncharacterized protein YggE
MNDKLELLGNNSIRIAVVGVLAILALFLFAETASSIQAMTNPTAQPADTITVNGVGQAALAPDIAHITFTVQQTAASVAAAQAAATKQANAAIAYVAQQGIADKDVTTLSYNIYPQYENVVPPCPPGAMCPVYNGGSGRSVITGYQVSESVQITVRDLTKASTLLAGLGSQGVQNISGPDFGLEDPAAGQNAARANAIADAKRQAQILADQLGVELGRVVSFSEGGGYYPMAYGKGGAVSADSAAVPAPNLPMGQNTYSASVSITYAIH